MKIAENMTNEELMQRELGKFERSLWTAKTAIDNYYSGLINMFELSDVLKEQQPILDKTATLYKIAELAYQLEVKYGREQGHVR